MAIVCFIGVLYAVKFSFKNLATCTRDMNREKKLLISIISDLASSCTTFDSSMNISVGFHYFARKKKRKKKKYLRSILACFLHISLYIYINNIIKKVMKSDDFFLGHYKKRPFYPCMHFFMLLVSTEENVLKTLQLDAIAWASHDFVHCQ